MCIITHIYDIINLVIKMIVQTFGERIKRLRDSNYISQIELSELTNINREQISRIENGQVNVTLNTIYKFCKAF